MPGGMNQPVPNVVTDFKGFSGLNGEYAMDTLEGGRSYLLVSSSGTQIKVSASAMQLLKAVEEGVSFSQLAATLNQNAYGNKARNVTAQQLEQAYSRLAEKLARIANASGELLPWGFWVRFKIIPQAAVKKLSSVLSRMYQPSFLVAALLVMMGCGLLAIRHGFSFELKDSGFFQGYLLFLLSLIIHELGHASACLYGGSEPSDIGFTIYLLYPAFYSDVSSAWRLGRWQRVMVDIGGNYFQLVVAALYLFGYYAVHWEPLRSAAVMIVYAAIFSLNPILKFDGYWIVADMLGVTNLAEQPARILSYFYKRMGRREVRNLPWPKSITAILVLYTAMTVAVWSRFVWGILPMIWYRCDRLRVLVNTMRTRMVHHQLPTLSDVRALVISFLLLLLVAVMVGNTIKQLWPTLRKWLNWGLSRYKADRERTAGSVELFASRSPNVVAFNGVAAESGHSVVTVNDTDLAAE